MLEVLISEMKLTINTLIIYKLIIYTFNMYILYTHEYKYSKYIFKII